MRLAPVPSALVLSLPAATLAAGDAADAAAARVAKASREERERASVARVARPSGQRVPMPFPFDIVAGPNGTTWLLRNTAGTNMGPFSGVCSQSPGVGVIDAVTAGAVDAYDFAYSLWVDGIVFAAATADVVGTTVTAGPVTMSGLNVTRQLFFSTTRQVMRVLDTFQNPTAGTINVVVQMPANFGSDDQTEVNHTSSGDLVFTTADRWVITSDSAPSDPVNTTVIAGPGTPAITPAAVTQIVFDCSFIDGAGWTFNLAVPAGTSRRLMAYAGLEDMLGTGNTINGAITNAAIFNDAMALHNTTDLTSGLTAAELLEIANWDFSFVPVELQSFGVE